MSRLFYTILHNLILKYDGKLIQNVIKMLMSKPIDLFCISFLYLLQAFI